MNQDGEIMTSTSDKRYTFVYNHKPYGSSQTSDEAAVFGTNARNIRDVLEAFARFLRCVGFVFDGHLEIVEDE